MSENHLHAIEMAETLQIVERYCKEIKGLSSNAYLKSVAVAETRNLMVDLCRQFYTLGWFVGTGGSISIKVHDDSFLRTNQLIVMSPSGNLFWISHYVGFVIFCITIYSYFMFYLKIMLHVGVQKERMVAEDTYVLSSDGSLILSALTCKPHPHKPPKCTDCAPLFLKVLIYFVCLF